MPDTHKVALVIRLVSSDPRADAGPGPNLRRTRNDVTNGQRREGARPYALGLTRAVAWCGDGVR